MASPVCCIVAWDSNEQPSVTSLNDALREMCALYDVVQVYPVETQDDMFAWVVTHPGLTPKEAQMCYDIYTEDLLTG